MPSVRNLVAVGGHAIEVTEVGGDGDGRCAREHCRRLLMMSNCCSSADGAHIVEDVTE